MVIPLRDYLMNEMNMNIVDFGEFPVFEKQPHILHIYTDKTSPRFGLSMMSR